MLCDHLPFETQPANFKNDINLISDDDSGDEYELHFKPLQAPTVPEDRSVPLSELGMEIEHRCLQLQRKVKMPVLVTPPPQEDQWEESSEPAEDQPDRENPPAVNLLGTHVGKQMYLLRNHVMRTHHMALHHQVLLLRGHTTSCHKKRLGLCSSCVTSTHQ